MSQPDRPSAGPPFVEPWHAQVFGLTHQLSRAGHFGWPEWSERFSQALAAAARAGAPSDGSAYYDIWLQTFEEFLIEKGLASAEALAELRSQWVQAYERTPHGAPVRLGAGDQGS